MTSTPRIHLMFWLDACLLVSICALETVPFTGLWVHEWLGVVVTALILWHLLMSWTWISVSSRRVLISPGAGRTKVNYFLNLSLFVSVIVAIFSGLLVSEVVLPRLGIKSAAGDIQWRYIHNRFSNFVLLFAGLHLAINWDWAVAAAKKCVKA